MNPVEYLLNAPHVWLADNFISIVINGYRPTESTIVPPSSFDLTGPRSLSKPEDELSQAVFENPTMLLLTLARLIKDQADGQPGSLLNDSSANMFYVRSLDGELYSVLVRFEEAQQLWRCGAYLNKNGLKLPNIRIFVPNESL